MGNIFDAFNKMLQGKPVFDESNDVQSQPRPQQTAPQAAPHVPLERPLITIGRIECMERGNQMALNVHIRNDTRQVVTLHKLIVFGRQDMLGYVLQPGQSRELREVYRGPLLPDTNRRTIELDYKAADGNLFRTVHRVEYDREADNAFAVREVTYESPIRDI